jgi:O-methyltransferase
MIDEMEVTTTLTVEELAENLAKELTGYDKIPLTDHQTLALREEGKDWPADALSMIGLKRMRNIHDLTKRIVVEKVPGDFMECGVWRGGASIFMWRLLAMYGETDRKVILADSFEGFPKDRECVQDRLEFAPAEYIAVSEEEVRTNFAKYKAGDRLHPDPKTVFVRGWFKDTLFTANIGRLALLRLDGDLFESTMTCLNALYSHVVEGGYVIIDDYALPTCRSAVDQFRERWGIKNEIHQIDYSGVWWRKGGRA